MRNGSKRDVPCIVNSAADEHFHKKDLALDSSRLANRAPQQRTVIPKLQNSKTPKLQNSKTPKLQNSKTPTFQTTRYNSMLMPLSGAR